MGLQKLINPLNYLKMKRYGLSLTIIIGAFLFSCNTDDNNMLEANAVLQWQGSYAVDGCGYFIEINNHMYKPDDESSIDAKFQENDSTHVYVEYVLLNKQIEYYCGMAPEVCDGIKIFSIVIQQ